jgi:hypothetical protein
MSQQKIFAWLMLNRGDTTLRWIRAEPPCNKGEVVIPLRNWHLVIGWQRKGNL